MLSSPKATVKLTNAYKKYPNIRCIINNSEALSGPPTTDLKNLKRIPLNAINHAVTRQASPSFPWRDKKCCLEFEILFKKINMKPLLKNVRDKNCNFICFLDTRALSSTVAV